MDFFNKVSTQEKVDFARNLALLIKSGIAIDKSLEIISDQSKPVFKKTLIEGKEKIKKGTSLSKAFESSSNFDKVFISFIKTGEESGTLGENLEFLADWLEEKNSLEKEIKSATLYPKIIIIFAVLLGGGLTVFVLPTLIPVFQTLDVQLPITTRILLGVSNIITEHGIIFLIGIASFSVLILLLTRIIKVKNFIQGVFLKIPIAGPLMKDYELAIISQLAFVLIRSGRSISSTLGIVKISVGNNNYEKAVNEVLERVKKGTSFSQGIKDYPQLFPGLFVNIITVGEETGSLSDSFKYLSDYFTSRVKEKTAKLPTVIEPALLITIGIFVAFIASAIIMPIYEITKGLY